LNRVETALQLAGPTLILWIPGQTRLHPPACTHTCYFAKQSQT